MSVEIGTFAEAVALTREHGLLGYGWAGQWPNYSAAETEALERLRREREQLEFVNRWAITQLSEETADCDPVEYFPRWQDVGIMMRRAHERYRRAEAEVLAELQEGGA